MIRFLSAPFTQKKLFFAGMALIVALLLPGLAWWQSVGTWSVFAQNSLVPGQQTYTLSKLIGLYAYLFVGLQSIYGLVGRHKLTSYSLWNLSMHRLLGLLTLTMVVMHLVLFMYAVTQRTGTIPFHLLLPDFTSGFYRASISLGLVSFVLMLCVIFAALTRNLWKDKWLLIHSTAPLLVFLSYFHAMLIGSEAKTILVSILYTAIAICVLIALIVRLRA